MTRLPLAAYTDQTITQPLELDHKLERIRRRGWADAYEERELELNAIAAPVWSGKGELAGIVPLQGSIPRFGRNRARTARDEPLFGRSKMQRTEAETPRAHRWTYAHTYAPKRLATTKSLQS